MRVVVDIVGSSSARTPYAQGCAKPYSNLPTSCPREPRQHMCSRLLPLGYEALNIHLRLTINFSSSKVHVKHSLFQNLMGSSQ